MKREPEGRACVLRHGDRYRYSLTHWWPAAKGAQTSRVAWVMLNPSTADALGDDPTMRRVRAFSAAWGYTSLEVVNLFAYRTKSPAILWERAEPVGRDNDVYIRQAIANADRVVVAWGAAKDERVAERVEWLGSVFRSMPRGRRPWCIAANADGSPKHPLYQKGDSKLRPWEKAASPFAPRSYSLEQETPR